MHTPYWVPFSQTTFSDSFSWMKILEFHLELNENVSPKVQLIKSQQGSDNGWQPNGRHAINWTNNDPVYYQFERMFYPKASANLSPVPPSIWRNLIITKVAQILVWWIYWSDKFVMTIHGATSDDEVGVMATLDFDYELLSSSSNNHNYSECD